MDEKLLPVTENIAFRIIYTFITFIYIYLLAADKTQWMLDERSFGPNPPAARRRRAAADAIDLENPAYAAISPEIFDISLRIPEVCNEICCGADAVHVFSINSWEWLQIVYSKNNNCSR